MPEPAGLLCVTCNAQVQGEYCHVCGQRRADLRDLSLRSIGARALDAMTDVDARFYRSYRALVTRPGALTVAYAQGRTVGWFSPLTLFFITTAIFFFYHTITRRATFFTLPLDLQLQDPVYGQVVTDMVTERFRALRGIRFTSFRMRFDMLLEEYAKVLVILMAPVLTLVLAAARERTREPVAVHFAFALHFLSMFLLALIIAPGVLWVIAGPLPPKAAFLVLDESVFLIVVGAAMLLYAFAALRRAYGARPVVALATALLLTASLLAASHLYRFTLFLIVFAIA